MHIWVTVDTEDTVLCGLESLDRLDLPLIEDCLFSQAGIAANLFHYHGRPGRQPWETAKSEFLSTDGTVDYLRILIKCGSTVRAK